jgi:eukaryotic-like serine/threonine-protein kinase
MSEVRPFSLLTKEKKPRRNFKSCSNHHSLVWNSPLVPLAQVQLGRAYAIQGDTAAAHTAYQDFFALWKDADPDIPILIQAKSEYAKLR